MNKTMHYDIIIIGGGMVGASLACALQDTPLRIALIDASAWDTQDDPRLIGLNYSSCAFFTEIGIWQAAISFAEPIQQVHISDRGHFGKLRINAKELDLPELGHVIPAKHLNQVLYDKIAQLPNVTLYKPAKLLHLEQSEQLATITIEANHTNSSLSCSLLVGADGTHSTVRELLQIKTNNIDYQQSALVTVTELQRPHAGIAYERFHTSGAIAMLPLQGNRCATIWTDDTVTIQKLQQLDDSEFTQTLQADFGYRLGKLLNKNKRYVFPLHMQLCEQTQHQHVILIGNAAHTIHPIAAQGLNLALAEIATLAKMLSLQASNLSKLDWHEFLALQQQRQKTSIQFSHQLAGLFLSDTTLLVHARQIGLLALDICSPLKKRFTWRALQR